MLASVRNDGNWPEGALPRSWTERVFQVMANHYGSEFADRWGGSDDKEALEEVMKHWAVQLFKLKAIELKSGIEAISSLRKAPNCSEFMSHCKASHVEATRFETVPKLERRPEITPEQALKNQKLLHASLGRVQSAQPSVEWAFRLVMRGESPSGLPIPHNVLKSAHEAISSLAGRNFISECDDEHLKENYQQIMRRAKKIINEEENNVDSI